MRPLPMLHKSSGRRRVCLAIRANIFGPISSASCNANTESEQPSRCNVPCDPDWRFIRHPERTRAARTVLAWDDGQTLTLRWTYEWIADQSRRATPFRNHAQREHLGADMA